MPGAQPVVVFGQPGGDPLQYPCVAQVQAVEVHDFALGWVGHRHTWPHHHPGRNLYSQSAKAV